MLCVSLGNVLTLKNVEEIVENVVCAIRVTNKMHMTVQFTVKSHRGHQVLINYDTLVSCSYGNIFNFVWFVEESHINTISAENNKQCWGEY